MSRANKLGVRDTAGVAEKNSGLAGELKIFEIVLVNHSQIKFGCRKNQFFFKKVSPQLKVWEALV
jgi:hypothetical protein